jgi:hypothetical protein
MTPLQREALQMCLEYIETNAHERRHVRWKIQEALAAPVQSLPFGVGGGLVAIKTLLSRDPCVHANTAIQMIDAILAEQSASVEPDWKAEYLKSVESGCITLDELREALAELEATNKQVEILSDALAESRREVAALTAVQEPVADRLRVVEGLLLKFQSVASNVARTHQKYMGKAMDDETYAHFAKARNETIPALRAELLNLYTTLPAAPVQPVAHINQNGVIHEAGYEWGPTNTLTPLYPTPPAAQRPWVGLTDDEIEEMANDFEEGYVFLYRSFARAIEAKLKELNT